MFGLSKLFAPVLDLFRKAATPLAAPSTDRELAAAEREIEDGAAIVEANVRAEWVRRARSMVGHGRYCLGAGGRDVAGRTPFGPCAKPDVHTHEHAGAVFCDCSGFCAWVVGVPRKHDGVWFYTDQLEADARGQVKGDLGDGVPWAQAQPGDLVVYGAGPKIGHVGIVSEVDATGPAKVIHCQASTTPAVVETSPTVFRRRGAVILRLRVK